MTTKPRVKDGMESLGDKGKARYSVYGWESDAAHTSFTGLALLVGVKDGVNLVGGALDVAGLAARLNMTWGTAIDLCELVFLVLGIEVDGWTNFVPEGRGALDAALAVLYA